MSDHFGGSDRSSLVSRTRRQLSASNYSKPFVCTCSTGTSNNICAPAKTSDSTEDILLPDLCEKSLGSIKLKRNSIVVPLGTLRFGVCRHRALLMKVFSPVWGFLFWISSFQSGQIRFWVYFCVCCDLLSINFLIWWIFLILNCLISNRRCCDRWIWWILCLSVWIFFQSMFDCWSEFYYYWFFYLLVNFLIFNNVYLITNFSDF